MSYRLIAINIDALWDEQGNISEANRTALIHVQKNEGVRVVLFGRYPLVVLTPCAQLLEMDLYSGYIISGEGASLTNCQTLRSLNKKSLPSEWITEFYSFLPEEVGMVAYNSQEAVLWGNTSEEEWKKHIPPHLSIPFRSTENPFSLQEDAIQRIELYPSAKEYAYVEQVVSTHGGGLVRLIHKEDYLELLPESSHLLSSLQYLTESLDYSMKNVISIGIQDQDVEMMQASGLGVAVANAPEAVKSCADYITTDSSTDAVAHLIEKHIHTPRQEVPFTTDDANEIMPNTLMGNLGIKCTDIAQGYVQATMPVDRRTRQPLGILHGGASLALAETVAGLGSVALLREGEMQVGAQVSGYHVASTLEGDIVRAEAHIIHRGKSTHVWNVDIYSTQSNKLICTCRVLNSILKRR